MDINELEKIVREARSLGCINVNLTGGEPLLRKDLKEIVKVISSNGLMVGLITNGMLIEPDLLQELRQNGLSEISVSIHGGQDYHDAFTGVLGAYQKAVRAIELSKKAGLNTVLNTIITHQSLHSSSIDEIKKIARSFYILIQPSLVCFPDKCLVDEKFMLNEQDLKDFKAFSEDPYIKPLHHNYLGTGFCPAGIEYIYINAYGEVSMCDLAQSSFGNVLREPLSVIWKRMLNKRETMGGGSTCIGLDNYA